MRVVELGVFNDTYQETEGVQEGEVPYHKAISFYR